jgi:hypothetical protein
VVLWVQPVPRARVSVVGAGGARRTSADPRELWEKGVEAPSVPPRPAYFARGAGGMAERTSETVIYGRTWLAAAMTAWTTAPMAPPLDTSNIHLMGAAGFTPTADTTLDALTAVEAAYTGYGPDSPGFSAPVSLIGGGLGLPAIASFLAAAPTPPDPFVGDIVTGWWVDDTTNVIAGGTFAPVPIAVATDWLLLVLLLPIEFQHTRVG